MTTREDDITTRLGVLAKLPPDDTVTKMLEADLRYLLDKCKRPDAERLAFVSAEEAAEWPEGTLCICAAFNKRLLRPSWLYCEIGRGAATDVYTHFARLPETLPELEGTNG